MIRSTTLPPKFFVNFPVKFVPEPKVPNFIQKEAKKLSKLDPLFSLFEKRSRKKKATAKPQFARYM